MINVTKTSLPDLNEYVRYLKEIWKESWVTNNGIYVQELEKKLEKELNVSNLISVSNGTLALQLAIKALDLKGEIITTPYSFAATTTAILWEGLTPVFADIDPYTFNIDPREIEKKITGETSAILAVHVYGNACNVADISKIAKQYKLKVIYDAAHAFGVRYSGRSLLDYGDISTLSFHATKTFHTIEGGATIAKDKKIYNKIKLLRNFGIKSEEEILVPGINAKMNEFQAVMGLVNLKYIEANRQKRENIYYTYREYLNSNRIQFQELNVDKYNYTYMPILLPNKKTRDLLYAALIDKGIQPRKYFYPLIPNYEYLKGKYKLELKTLQNSVSISNRVLCLPIYPDLAKRDIMRIIKTINETI
jgi:dTDP-4-amino-4,6-dideoxygalactose transaminase